MLEHYIFCDCTVKRLTILCVVLFWINWQCQSQGSLPANQDYLGQALPGNKAVLFAPGIVNRGFKARDISISPNGRELYFSSASPSSNFTTIYVIKMENGVWTKPEVAPFAQETRYRYGEAFIAPDGKKLYFISKEPLDKDGQPKDWDIWVMDKEGFSWERLIILVHYKHQNE